MLFDRFRTGRQGRALSVSTKSETKKKLRRAVACALESLEGRQLLSAVVSTDQLDYAPGSIAYITAKNDDTTTRANFMAGETIQFVVTRTDGVQDFPPANQPWTATADANGSVRTSWYVDSQYAGASLLLTATGLTSHAVATEAFTDARSTGSVSIGTQTGTATYGTFTNTVTYLVTVHSTGAGNGSSGLLSVSGLPTGVAGVFSPTSVSFSNGSPDPTSTLTLTIQATAEATTSHSFTVSVDSKTATGSLTIGAKAVTITATAGQNKVYGASDPTLAYTHSALANGDTDSVFSGALARAAGSNVANYAINLGTLSAGTNYSLSLFDSPTFAITAAPLTITATAGQNKVYGTSDPTLAYTHSALANGDTNSVFSGALARAAGSNVANYAINLGTLSAGTNYSLSLFDSPTFSITAAPLTITATAGQNKVYGTSDPTLAYTHGALANGDTNSVFSGALARAAGSNVGNYAINLGSLSAGSNYSLSLFGSPTFAITAAPLTIKADSDLVTAGQQSFTKVYGASDPAFTYSVSGLTNGDTAASVLAGSLTRAVGESVAGGPYAIGQGGLVANSNYTISFTGSTLSITPAPLTIKADSDLVTAGQQSFTKVYGASDPTFTYSVSGLTNGDTAASVLTGSLTRAVGESVAGGPYAIGQGGLVANSNYTISFTGSTLSITPAAATAAWQLNGETAAQRSAVKTIVLNLNGTVPTSAITLYKVVGAVLTPISANIGVAGSVYTITPTGNLDSSSYSGLSLADGNYQVSVADSNYNISGQTFNFFRLLGDFDGNRKVDATDAAKVRLQIGKTIGTTNWFFDVDGIGGITSADYYAVVALVGHTI